MKLRVKNFGPISEADVELKPLTVFVGPSNTGKSYLAILLYSIAKTLRDENRGASFSFRRALHKLLRELEKMPSEKPADDKASTKIVDQSLSFYVDEIAQSWQAEAERCFGEEWGHIAPTNNGAGCDIEIRSQKNDTALNLTHPDNSKLPSVAPLLAKMKKFWRVITSENDEESRMMYLVDLPRRIFPYIVRAFDFLPEHTTPRHRLRTRGGEAISENVHYLPAVRGGIMQSHRTLVSALVKGASRISITGASIIPFTGVLGDFLNKLITIQDSRPSADPEHASAFSKLPDTIERDIMDGEIRVEMSATEYPDFRYAFLDKNKKPRDIPLMSASSSVSELAPIVLFMQNYLSPGDIFIVEEPEAHLHPAAQRGMAGALADLVNAGVYVVVTTHSDVILEQLSNFIHADGVLDAKVLNKESKERTISENDAAAYSFTKQESGTIVRKIPFDRDTGMLTEDHLDSSSDLYNETVDIFNCRQRGGKNDD